jgi:hypothetical protein
MVDYTDYDHSAPRVQFVNPFTELPYETGEVPPSLLRRVVTLTETGARPVLIPLIARRHAGPMWVCVPGTRHYYEHPAAAGHAWAAARARDAGALPLVVDQLRIHIIETTDPGGDRLSPLSAPGERGQHG